MVETSGEKISAKMDDKHVGESAPVHPFADGDASDPWRSFTANQNGSFRIGHSGGEKTADWNKIEQ